MFEFLEIEEWLITEAIISAQSFSFEINDLSMSPDFQIGDKIILDPTLQAEAGDFVLATSNGQDIFSESTVRVASLMEKSFELYPLNEDFEIFHSSHSDLKTLGVMVEHRKYRRK